MAVNTKRVAGRRTLHFTTLDEALRDAESLAAGPHRSLGNYTLGQVAAHLAQPIEYCLDGFPPVKLPWLLRTAGPLMKGRILKKGMPAGVQMPPAIKAIFTPPDATTEEGLARLRRGIERLKAEPQRHPSPLLGKLTREEWERFHCRHAELHLSFISPQT